MRFHHIPPPVLQLLATFIFHPRPAIATPNPNALLGKLSFNDLFGRDCAGTYCGYYSQLCCTAGSACYTGADSIASCTAAAAGGAATTAANGGSWVYYTTTYVETDLVTTTKVMSSYIAGASSTAGVCPASRQCGNLCCPSGQYCFDSASEQCQDAAFGGSGSASATYAATSTGNPGAVPPLLGTSVSQTTVVATVSPSTTVPFVTPVATGSNVTVTSQEQSGGGLSGGAIAGIVIGTLAGLALLALLIFCCCVRGLIDGCFALFGIGGRKKRRTVEVEEYEHGSHHRHGAAGGTRRTWYGAARPARVVEKREKSHEGRNLLGIGMGLAALWAFLGLKRRREQRNHDARYSDVSGSDYTYDYTSASSVTRSDRRPPPSRYSRR